MKVFFNQLFDYNFYCNKSLIEKCSELNAIPERSETLFSHILNAHHIWNARILNQTPIYDVWQKHDIKSWEDIHYDNQRNSFEIVTNATDFDKRIDYESTDGRSYTNTLGEMLFHIINHSTHHRAQMSIDFRSNEIDPISLDYIFYKR
ncbi:DinB family protein [Eudoraea chungangensis]|uniref:DinB family protein n=1 Tax=Eudoraea chungangensis TaxID=1481905 RepID=UPI0023ED4DF2|nr:DinB family protein [Eudoraea chungangensis]